MKTFPRSSNIYVALFAGIACTLIGTIGIRLAHDPVWIRIFDNLHWTASTSAAAVVAWLVFKRAEPDDAKGLFWIALGLSGYAVGQIFWDIQAATGYTNFPAPSDIFYLLLGPLVAVGLFREIASYTTPAQRKTIWLDTATLTVVLLTLVLALYLPKRGETDWLSMLVLVAYPTTLLTAAITALTMLPTLRLRINTSLLLFISGLVATGMSWMHWNFLALDGIAIDGSWFNPSFSAAVLLIAVALARWKVEVNPAPEWDRVCESALRLLPLITVVIASVSVVLSHTLADLPYFVQVVADTGAVVVVVLSMIRQGTLMKERDELVALQKALIESQGQLVKEQGQLKTLLSTIPDLVWLKDADGVYLSCNRSFEKLYGCSEHEIVGKSDYDFVSSEQADSFRQHDLAAMETKGSRINEEWLTFADDSYRGLFETIKTPMYDNHGSLIGVLGIARNITERKQAQDEILAQQQELSRLSQALQQAGECIIITSPDAEIEYVNPAFSEITGYTYDEVMGRKTSLLKSNQQDASFYRELWQTITAGRKWEGNLINRRKDGSFFPAMISIAPVFNDEREIAHYVAIIKDVTELKQLEQQLVQIQKMEAVGTLVGGIAHDFNNMLAAVQGNLYVAKKAIDDKLTIAEKLENIETLVGHAAGVVRQLLSFAKRDITEAEVINLNRLIEEGFSLARSTIPENIQHKLQICEEQLNIEVDPVQLQQVMINLSNNARDALEGADQPLIEWRLEHYVADEPFMNIHPDINSRELAKISVSDNGSGIERERLGSIFDPFYTTKEEGKGTGLGLAISFSTVQRFGGVIEVDSMPGRGTTFEVYLPLSQSSQIEPAAETEPVLASGNQEGILLVDDEEHVRSTTAEVLRDLGYRVFEAGDGEQALALYQEHADEIDLLLSDVIMPKMGGPELVEAIRRIDPEIPVILASGYDQDNSASRKRVIENCRFLTKPYSFERLGNYIQQMLS
ncbi:PAS domain S-box-containing protein [Mariprofundus ferrinatatus]|uniref:histidine kinase n=1 Tax=Mariprofundus ferrinatatus TaxID=1921087 RepID=A0A2K8L6N7_9PROT|nr:PAS domain S-box protein [Mariprofundus ferrinatatus]ATX82995.1 PAS domain S-box-containing protein [Mariprofundus ferrinatatus]